MSSDTIARRIHNLAEEMEDQLIAQVKSSKYYSLQLDESTDIANKVILAVFCAFRIQRGFEGRVLFSDSLPSSITGKELFKSLNDT